MIESIGATSSSWALGSRFFGGLYVRACQVVVMESNDPCVRPPSDDAMNQVMRTIDRWPPPAWTVTFSGYIYAFIEIDSRIWIYFAFYGT